MPLRIFIFGLIILCSLDSFAQDSTQRSIQLKEIVVDTKRAGNRLNQIQHKQFLEYSGASGSFEQLLRWMPGVSASNEMSSQYNVRGGSFDENLVYLNGIEIYRPIMSRTAQQEGLSIIHPDLVSSIEFSAGGFGAEFGDKMSSVLNVNYRKPKQNEGRISTSLLGGSIYLGGRSTNNKWHSLIGARYKTSNYLLEGMDEKGSYRPAFFDVQTAISYQQSSRLSWHFLGTIGRNDYQFIPESRETSFGTLDQPRKFVMYYEGNEKDAYLQSLCALGLNYRNDQIKLSVSAAWTRLNESETYDILGTYRLRDIESSIFVPDPTEGINNDLASMQEHARNFLYSDIINVAHQGSANVWDLEWNWGAGLQWMDVEDHLSQWRMIDSAGFSIPTMPNEIAMDKYVKADNQLTQMQGNAFIQVYHRFSLGQQDLSFRLGSRFLYAHRNGEWIISPRCDLEWRPSFKPTMRIYLAGGNYAQPLFYREMRDPDGNLHKNLKAQQAWHALLGCNLPFEYGGVKFQLHTEMYTKYLMNLIPYRMDNLRIEYAAQNNANGQVLGLDLKLNAQLLKDAESWANISFLKAQQRIGSGSYFVMPNDQFVFASVFFQDYFNNNPLLRVQAMMNFGAGLPAQNPDDDRYDSELRLPAYRRIDLGFSYEIFNNQYSNSLLYRLRGQLKGIRQITLGLEALNLFGFMNTASYLWVKTLAQGGVCGGMVAVPNYLSPLRVNLKMNVNF